ncbi:MAG: hypothetical protein ACYC0H_09930 [Solirubrobacteraceae bacterium]
MVGGSEGLGREIVLGLLVEEPGNAYQVEMRLRERFASHDYTQGVARQSLLRLGELGFARSSPAAPGGRVRSRIWEATPEGVARSRAWIREQICKPPVREELHAKIALCQPPDLPRLLEVVCEAERMCVRELQEMNHRTRLRRAGRPTRDWTTSMDLIVSAGEQAWWDSRIKWLQSVRRYLEREVARPPARLAPRT